ncbi:uncharacterized protein B0H18DRAFT_1026175 [Fomitopsis serialis]|uniref:uncharacterized protein n=1 Tax=Fomitopsis serialis TaxID=139415 RepID=UPI0020081DD5|nr:uncharacterized protein B0H18DRAFT_1026175 [Neoantrodia serialis]KAH9919918.1 hypothetical protein B0H18DRAFT_1026175 [Neoantrodia serialis]
MIATLRPKTSGPTPYHAYRTRTAPAECLARSSPPNESRHERHSWRESLAAEQRAHRAPCLPSRTRPIHEPRRGNARLVNQQRSPIVGDIYGSATTGGSHHACSIGLTTRRDSSTGSRIAVTSQLLSALSRQLRGESLFIIRCAAPSPIVADVSNVSTRRCFMLYLYWFSSTETSRRAVHTACVPPVLRTRRRLYSTSGHPGRATPPSRTSPSLVERRFSQHCRYVSCTLANLPCEPLLL